MQKVEVRFQFPDVEDRDYFKNIQSLDELKTLIDKLKSSQKYVNYSVNYLFREWQQSLIGLQKQRRMVVYFSCCQFDDVKPVLLYTSKNSQKFKLHNLSRYFHHHIVNVKEQKQISIINTSNINQTGQVLQQQKSYLIQQIQQKGENANTHQKQILQQTNFKMIKEYPQKSKKQIQKNQKQKQKKSKQLIKKIIFQFPSKQELSQIQAITSRESILGKIGRFVQIRQIQNMGIRCQGKVYEYINNQGQNLTHIIIGFKCCRGVNKTQPFLHYIKKGINMFKLQSYNNKHDHLNGLKKVRKDDKQLMDNLFQKLIGYSKQNSSNSFSLFQLKNKRNHHKIDKRKNKVSKILIQQQNGKDLNKQKCSQKTNPINKNLNTSCSHKLLNTFQDTPNQSFKARQFSYYQNQGQNQRNQSNEEKTKINSNNQKQNYQENKMVTESFIQQIPKKDLIFCDLQNYSQKISTFIVQKQWKHNKIVKKNPQEMQSQQDEDNQQFINYRIQDRKIWTQCILQILKYNDIQILQIQTHKQNSVEDNLWKFETLLFVNKAKDINTSLNKKKNNCNESLQIYLSVYPMQVATKSEEFSILVGYTLTSQNDPNLLWFYVTKKNESCSSLQQIFERDNKSLSYEKVLKQSVKYFDLKRASFIYTTMDHKLLTALDRICQLNEMTDSEFKFNSLMHFSCLMTILDDQNFPQDQILEEQIKMRINNFSNLETIQKSFRILKNVLNNQNQQSQMSIEEITNPRIIFENYQNFTRPFSNTYKDKQSSKIRFAQFFNHCYDHTVQENTETPFKQLDQIFNHFNEFSNFAQAFIFILKTFDPTLRKVPQIISKKRIVPFVINKNKIKNQTVNFKLLNANKEKLHNIVRNIFSQPNFQLNTIARESPRFISMVIQDLIIAADQLVLNNLKQSIPQHSKSKFYVDNQPGQSQKTFKVSFIDELNKKNYQQKESIFYSQEDGKKWSCTCNFYRQTGIPCQHQILAAIQTKSSLFKEINSCWMNKN